MHLIQRSQECRVFAIKRIGTDSFELNTIHSGFDHQLQCQIVLAMKFDMFIRYPCLSASLWIIDPGLG
jgi:hypothetical protein